MDEEEKVVVSAKKVQQLLDQNKQYKQHLQYSEDIIQTLKSNEEKYETNIKQLQEQLNESKESTLQFSAKNQALNDLLQKKDASITTLQNQIVEYNRNDPGKILQTTLSVLYTVPQIDYTKLSLDELNTELQKIRFSHQSSSLDNVQESEMDQFMKTKLSELEKLQKLNSSQENLISQLKIQIEHQNTQITNLTSQNNERLIQQNKETYDSFNSRIQNLQYQLQQLSETNKQLKLERDQFEQQSNNTHNDLQVKIKDLETDNIAITELCRQQNDENMELKQILNEMQTQLQDQEQMLKDKADRPDINQVAQTDFSINNQEIMYKVDFEQLIEQKTIQHDQQLCNILDQFISILQPIQTDVLVNRQNINEHLGNFVKQFNDMLIDLQKLAHENEKLMKQQNNYKDEISKLELDIQKLQTEKSFANNTIESYKLQVDTIQKQRQEQGDVLSEKNAETNALFVKINQMEVQIANQANNIQQLQQENAALQQENQSFITETNKLNQTLSGMTQMQEVITKYEEKITSIASKHKQLQAKYEEAVKQGQQHQLNATELQNKIQEIQQLSLEYEKTTSLQISDLKQNIAQLEIENKHLKQQIESLQQQKQEIDKLTLNQNAEYGRTQSLIQQNQVEIAKLNAEVSKLQTQLEAAGKRLEEKELQIVQLNNDKEELNIHYGEARQKLADANQTMKHVDDENRNLKLKLESEIASNSQKSDKITDLINEKNTELQKLQQENFQLKVQYDGVQKEKQLISEQISELKQKNERLEEQKDRNLEQITAFGVQTKTLERECEELRGAVAQARLQADSGEQNHQSAQKELATLRQQLTETLQKHSALALQNQQLQDEILHQKTQYEIDFQELRSKLESTFGAMNERNIGQKDEVICTLNLEIVNRKKEATELREQLADSAEQLQEQKQVAKQQADKYVKLEEQFKTLKENTYEMKKVYEDKIKALKEEKQTLQTQQSQLAGSAKTEVIEVQQRLRAEYASHINDIVKKNRELQISNDQMQVACNDYKMEIERLKYQAENVKNSMESLNSALEKEKQDVGRYKELYRRAYSIVQNKKDEIKQYQAVIKDMDRQVSTITQQRYSQAYGDPGSTFTPPSASGLPRQSIQARAAQSGNYLPPAPAQDLGYQDLHE